MKSIHLTFVLAVALVGGCQSTDESVEAPALPDSPVASETSEQEPAAEVAEEPAVAVPENAVAGTEAPSEDPSVELDAPSDEPDENVVAPEEGSETAEVDLRAQAIQPALDLLAATQSGDFSLVPALCDPAHEGTRRPVCNAAFGSLCAENGPGTLCIAEPTDAQLAELSTLLHTSSLASGDVAPTLGVDELSATFIVHLGPDQTERVMFYTVRRDAGWFLYDILDVPDDAVYEEQQAE